MAGRMKPYTCTYRFKGRAFGFVVEAESYEDASARMRAIGMTAVADGEFVYEGNLFPGAGLLRRVSDWLSRRNGRTAS